MIRLKGSLLFIFISLFLTPPLLFSQAYLIPDLQRDDFTSDKTWWKFQNHGSQALPTSFNGYLFVNLVNALNGNNGAPIDPNDQFKNMHNVGIATADQRPIYGKDDRMIATIRVKTLNTLLTGSRGWGFWKSEGVPVEINQAVWFMEQKAHADSVWAAEETWWRARTHRTKYDSLDFRVDLDGSNGSPHNYDNMQWHTYKIVRQGRDRYEHYVDGVLVQSLTPADFADGKIMNADYSFNCWNDNIVYRQEKSVSTGIDTIAMVTHGWIGTSQFVVDFIEIRKESYVYGESRTPINSIKLREVVNEIDDGITDGSFKGPYSFTTSGGPVTIIATGKAEEMDTHDDDDDMKMILNGTDFGFNTNRSWNGTVDQATLKTIVIDTTLSAGTHTLSFESEVTPILYDATVLAEGTGAVVLNQTVNESAPIGSNNLEWKTYNFNADAGELVIYISGSADEEPGWNHQTAFIDSSDDDELRIELDGFDFGWQSDSASFVGNTLFGDGKTICIRKEVATSGNHTLRLFSRESPFVHKVLVYARAGDSALPVELSQFSAQRNKNICTINWVTESEVQNAGFNIFRAESKENIKPTIESFTKINQHLIAGAGNSAQKNNYSFKDETFTENSYLWYYVQDVSFSGKIENSKVISVVPDGAPTQLALHPNFPNPFNPVTHIPITIIKDQHVTIDVFDLNGKRVKQLVNKPLKAGYHQFMWRGINNNNENVASGIYLYRIQAGKSVKTRKMTLIR